MNAGRSLLTPEERVICQQISERDNGLYRHRARALLALDEGMTQRQAGERAGLTETEVIQCLEAFRQLRTAGIYSAQTELQPARSEPVFSSQLGATDASIGNLVKHLKRTQHELKSSRAVPQPDREIKPLNEPAGFDGVVEESGEMPNQLQAHEEDTGALAKPEKKKKAGGSGKSKKPKNKPKKPKKPKRPKNKKPKKRKKRKKNKKRKK